MSTKTLRIMVLTCSTRPGALGPAVAEWFARTVAEQAASLDAELVPVSLGELALPFHDEPEHPSTGAYAHPHTQRWSAMVDDVDGFVFVTPEYNFGMPAALKNALDYLYREWAWKPVGFVSYGNTSAGTRSVQHAKQVVTTLRLVPAGETVAIRIRDGIQGGRVHVDARTDAAARRLLAEVTRLAHALRPMREAGHPASVPGPLPGSYMRPLAAADAGEVLVLQRCCWVEEALVNDTLGIDALHESLDDVRAWLGTWNAHGLWLDGRLIGMVRTRRDGTSWHIGRLAVAPDLRGTGLGRRLLQWAEASADADIERIELFTGARSVRNIAIYERDGFRIMPDAPVPTGVVGLEKRLEARHQDAAPAKLVSRGR